MTQQTSAPRFRTVGDGTGLSADDTFTREELQLASRNRGMPLEGLRYAVTPTGMHYLLVHFDIPEVDATSWRLDVGGLVSKPLSLSLDELRDRPAVTHTVTMECAGNGRALLNPRPLSQPWLLEAIGTADWTGTPLRGILDEAGVDSQAVEVLFTGRDRGVQGDEVQDYQRSLTLDEATRGEVLLAYEMNGEPLQPQHGYPVRLLVPGWYGMTSVKWLDRVDAISHHFDGYQMERSYRYRQSADEPGEPVELIRVRSLMVPPGIPDFMTRARLVSAGRVELIGRAWAGRLGISRVEVSADEGSSWSDAKLDARAPEFAWRRWSFEWEASAGRHTLCVRATDTEGNVQPVEQPWNIQGMGNNMAQRVEVIVE
ncbi:MAG: sulfite oxidase [Chloroflexi bacterium]|nr:sulfite oxidase [Chloroflexota bacterium]